MVNRPLKILFVTAELAPLVSTGGLADVTNALSKNLAARGHDVRIAMPAYRHIPKEYLGKQRFTCKADLGIKTVYGAMRETRLPGSQVPVYLVEHDDYFGRDYLYGTHAYEYEDNAERFCFFSLATLNGIEQSTWMPDIVHCHDWHTSLIPSYLKTRYAKHPDWKNIPTLFTIHNLAFQGRYPADKFSVTGFDSEMFDPATFEFYGDMNLMKACIALTTRLNTVSPRYAREIQTQEYGEGLDGMLRTRQNDLTGILNGVDYTVWNPEKDTHIAENYTKTNLSGKKKCKQALQQEFGLPIRDDIPLIGLISRLTWQKGFDLVADALRQLSHLDAQFVILGTGQHEIEQRLVALSQEFPEKLRVVLAFDVPKSHRVQAGIDFFLMPSRYEPCGLTQMYALAYGSIPIVRRTGGLADTVRNINSTNLSRGTATGISFVPVTAAAIIKSIKEAIALYKNKDIHQKVQLAGMKEDFSWERSGDLYLQDYQAAIEAVKESN